MHQVRNQPRNESPDSSEDEEGIVPLKRQWLHQKPKTDDIKAASRSIPKTISFRHEEDPDPYIPEIEVIDPPETIQEEEKGPPPSKDFPSYIWYGAAFVAGFLMGASPLEGQINSRVRF